MSKINASDAMIKVIEEWGVKTIYGLPSGSFDFTMNVLHNRQDTIRFVQVRHEEAGALAAVGEAKVTGKIAVTFGSAGPGAVHLLNGLYDAKHDGLPLLALIGQVPTSNMNKSYFQELNENPIFEDVAVYNRTVMTAEQMPYVVDEAIRQAYAHKGVALVTIPKDLGWQEIEDKYTSTASHYQKPILPEPSPSLVEKALAILQEAKRPLIYIGLGTKGARQDIMALAKQLKAPILSSAPAKGIIPDNFDLYMGSAGRVATKPGVEMLQEADTIITFGTDMPFQGLFTQEKAKYIQVDIDGTKFGRRHHVDLAILADAKKTIKALLEKGEDLPITDWYQVAISNKKNWEQWVKSFEADTQEPLRVEPVFKAINDLATKDAIFQIDVGNVTIDAVRYLKMNDQQAFTTSGWYATMGYALPAAIGAQAAFPNRQVWSISGDGGWTMNMQDIATAVKYKLPIINVILTNESLGFIEAEQDDMPQPHSGIDLIDINFGEAATAMGAKGFEVRTRDDLETAFKEASQTDGPIVIDVKIANERPLPVEQLKLDPNTFSPETIKSFTETYKAQGLKPFSQLLKEVQESQK
ncbi:pyruvate oxidase [Streptococcus pseudoporcinus]|uniref:Pyruvate oxidase n=1 Tax=Streptococcus pseudoporcinus LQ 940-04 TaxID=875093 RepID=G5KAK6_9STRE|nr:pyruvate oxidase [Streptococcus pseudoporcinus]EFR44695.1 pyruvate oxidase [Streptococcus pseudoporcinus SPIN 20026]EHI64834.1 pyruvate oxidase [Streptococcus pseudoporcinus LQ 940-04]VEF93088.1 pyruvate oxidase [Streptococcus pseudoporcinus]